MALTLVYETHSTTTDNEAGIATGWLPGELSAAGRRQAAEMGERRRAEALSAVYVSDLKRALDTVTIAFAAGDVPVLVDERLRECNYGRYNGRPRAELDVIRRDHIDRPWPEGESYRDVVVRTRSLLDDVQAAWAGQRILWVGHAANAWALEHLVNGLPVEDFFLADREWQPGWEFRVK